MLIRAGYFNLINGYKNPFISGTDGNGNHIYIPDTSIEQIHYVKRFDESLRSFLLKYITQIEEEVRTLTGYKFDTCNDNGKIPWYETAAYSSQNTLQEKMGTISKAYSELSRSELDYVQFYMTHHKKIPTWIMLKVVNFSTFINVLRYSKSDVKHSICILYGLIETKQSKTFPNVKLLIGSLHWMRKIRNACAHNERIYCLSRPKGRILETYLRSLRPAYSREKNQKLFDLMVYFKYYLPLKEYQQFISELKGMLFDLKGNIDPIAFDHIRGQMGIIALADLDALVSLPKDDIDYNKFDKA
jgi:abortive infection bacteriophage resistance protein